MTLHAVRVALVQLVPPARQFLPPHPAAYSRATEISEIHGVGSSR